MQEAAEKRPGTMTSVIGLDYHHVKEACDRASQKGLVSIANLNCPGQIVVSGEKEAVARVSEIAREMGAKKTIELKVAGAFHSELMLSAKEKLEKTLLNIDIKPPQIPVIANISADFTTEPEKIRQSLADQLISPVLWQKSMERLRDSGTDLFIEVGCGSVLRGLMKRIDRQILTIGVTDTEELQEALKIVSDSVTV